MHRLLSAGRIHWGRSRLGRGVVAALLSRGVAAATGLLAIPLTLGYLGPERYGVWVVITTALLWLSVADLGLSNGLLNRVATAHGQGRPDQVRQAIAATLVLLSGIAGPLILLTLLVAPRLNWASLLNVQSSAAQAEVGLAMTLALMLAFMGFPLTLVRKILEGLQEGDRAYLVATAVSLSGFTGLLVVTGLRGGLPWLVLGVLGSQIAAWGLGSSWFFWRYRPDLRPTIHDLDRQTLGGLVQIGWQFFLVQILALINLSSDTFIITRVLGPEAVAPYHVTWQLFAYTTLVQQLSFNLVWARLAEAAGRADGTEVRRTYWRYMAASVGSTVLLAVPLALVAEPFIAFWTHGMVVLPPGFVFWVAGWNILLAFMNSNACLLNSHGWLRGQLSYGSLTALANIGLSLWLAPQYGITGVVIATVLAYLVCGLLPSQFEAWLLFRRRYGS
ncbi:MAG: lipopolysaccharide biosynthesis protein [Oscillochloridaceae bacterium umkhey_bin13]